LKSLGANKLTGLNRTWSKLATVICVLLRGRGGWWRRILILIIITLLRKSVQNIWLLSDEEHLQKRHSIILISLEFQMFFSVIVTHIYSQTCIKRSPLRKRESGLSRQVTP